MDEVALVAAVPTQNDSTHLFAQRGNHIRHAESYKNVTTESATTAKHTTVKSPWGGAILRGSGFTAASAVVNVPEASGGSSASGSAWVGIDGDTCDRAILQTGFNWYGDGSYVPWYEWYPGLSG
ncbi:hypothetical protein DH86_00004265 [Scytalidium sp. 3C]|nr:hypothetical protein DH86_00004265 [Scytalidium sp. 3C]